MSKDPAFLFYSGDFLTGTMLMDDDQVGKYIRLLCLQHQKGSLSEKDMLKICISYDEDIFSKFMKDDDGKYYSERLRAEINKRRSYSESRRKNRQSTANKGTKGKKSKDDGVMKVVCGEGDEDMKNICDSHDPHMENENEIINKDINDIDIDIEKIKDINNLSSNLESKFSLFVRTYESNYGSLTDDEIQKLKSDLINLYAEDADRLAAINRAIDKKQKSFSSHAMIAETLDKIESEFVELWSEYPRKEGKADALKHYRRYREKGSVTFDEAMNGIKAYKEQIKHDRTAKKYIKHGSSWFNQQSWQDDYTIPSDDEQKDEMKSEADEWLRAGGVI